MCGNMGVLYEMESTPYQIETPATPSRKVDQQCFLKIIELPSMCWVCDFHVKGHTYVTRIGRNGIALNLVLNTTIEGRSWQDLTTGFGSIAKDHTYTQKRALGMMTDLIADVI